MDTYAVTLDAPLSQLLKLSPLVEAQAAVPAVLRSTLGQPESVLKHLDQKHLATPTHYKMLREKDDEGGREGQQGGREGVRRRGRDGGKGGGCRGRLQGGMPGGREAGGGQGDRVTQGGRHGGRQGGGGQEGERCGLFIGRGGNGEGTLTYVPASWWPVLEHTRRVGGNCSGATYDAHPSGCGVLGGQFRSATTHDVVSQ